MSDWADHLTTIFPEVRLKQFLEMRGADSGPWRRLCALSALWVGLLYDADCQRAAWNLVKDWTPEDHAYLRKETPKSGLHTEFRGRTMKDLAADVVAIADTGLRNRAIPDKNGDDESSFLLPLHEIIDRGYSPAERLLQRYETEWNKSVDPIYVEYAY
jgi:glutamate--cysteine ligase